MKFIMKNEPNEAERLFDKYVDKKLYGDFDSRVKRLSFYSPEARAAEFYNLIKGKSQEEVNKISSQALQLGGIITEGRFMESLMKLMIEDNTDFDKIKKLKTANKNQ